MTDTFTIILNKNNVSNLNTNMEYTYNFSQGFIINDSSQLCLNSLSIPYSWYNISNYYGNNTFSYIYAGVTYNITIPNGYYDATGLQDYFQQIQIQNNQYLINNTTGNYMYFINFIQNINTYSNQFYFYPVPSSIGNIPSGYSAPSGFVFSTDNSAPQIIINNTAFGSLIGYLPSTYPSIKQYTSCNVIGNTIPDLNPVSCLVIRCSLINNSIGSPSDILTSIPISGVYGNNLIFNPNYANYVSLKSGEYQAMIITITDQNFNLIYANDYNICINLTLSQPKK